MSSSNGGVARRWRARHQSTRSPSIAAISSSTNACVERHATTARFPRASSRPIALSRWVFPRPLLPTSTSGLYFLPGCFSTARAAPTATSLDGPTAYAASGKAPDEVAVGAARAVLKQPGKKYNPLVLVGKSGLGKTHLLNA